MEASICWKWRGDSACRAICVWKLRKHLWKLPAWIRPFLSKSAQRRKISTALRKLYVEQLGQSYRECHGLEFVSLRIVRVVGAGLEFHYVRWRSEIFEMLNANEPVEISIPYAGSERVLVAHVDDVGSDDRRDSARGAIRSMFVYNSPCESLRWRSEARIREAEPNVANELRFENSLVRLGESVPA